jgi:hypothetical protein
MRVGVVSTSGGILKIDSHALEKISNLVVEIFTPRIKFPESWKTLVHVVEIPQEEGYFSFEVGLHNSQERFNNFGVMIDDNKKVAIPTYRCNSGHLSV